MMEFVSWQRLEDERVKRYEIWTKRPEVNWITVFFYLRPSFVSVFIRSTRIFWWTEVFYRVHSLRLNEEPGQIKDKTTIRENQTKVSEMTPFVFVLCVAVLEREENP